MADHVDDLVRRILVERERQEPDSDPGDITIRIQDDMDLVEVVQRGQVLAFGPTLSKALHQALRNVKRRRTAEGPLRMDT